VDFNPGHNSVAIWRIVVDLQASGIKKPHAQEGRLNCKHDPFSSRSSRSIASKCDME